MGTPVVIYKHNYVGWESLQDWNRNMGEALDGAYNPLVGDQLLGEFEGTLTVTITYTPK